MTGSAGWSYFAATRYILGLRPGFDAMVIDPCIPPDWKGFTARRIWRGAAYEITVENPVGISKGIRECWHNGTRLPEAGSVAAIPAQPQGSVNSIRVVMG
jgi:N,N'-diacetylchitobiose phosphorylase